jgi:hypothetical protein
MRAKDNSPFNSYTIEVKSPEVGKQYDELPGSPVSFESNNICLEDVHNLEVIISEMNDIPKLLFRFRLIMDTQTKILQQLEDEYAKWYAIKWMEVDSQVEPKHDKQGAVISFKKVERTEGAKEKVIITTYSEEYTSFQEKLREERYKLAILKSTTAALDNYSYKLHAILNYKQMLESKNIS